MYSEITKDLFLAIVDKEAETVEHETTNQHYAYTVPSLYGVGLKLVHNHVASVTQYFIIDINA